LANLRRKDERGSVDLQKRGRNVARAGRHCR